MHIIINVHDARLSASGASTTHPSSSSNRNNNSKQDITLPAEPFDTLLEALQKLPAGAEGFGVVQSTWIERVFFERRSDEGSQSLGFRGLVQNDLYGYGDF